MIKPVTAKIEVKEEQREEQKDDKAKEETVEQTIPTLQLYEVDQSHNESDDMVYERPKSYLGKTFVYISSRCCHHTTLHSLLLLKCCLHARLMCHSFSVHDYIQLCQLNLH